MFTQNMLLLNISKIKNAKTVLYEFIEMFYESKCKSKWIAQEKLFYNKLI